MSAEAGSTQLYVLVQAGEDALDQLRLVLDSSPVASVLIVPAPGGALSPTKVRPLVEVAQSKGAAAMIADDAPLAVAVSADGVHLSSRDDLAEIYREARQRVGQQRIVGVNAGTSRHHAMVLGEAGADYVGFDLPQDIVDHEEAAGERLELVAWWAEVFQVPCVAFGVATVEEARLLASAGADFVGITLPSGNFAAAAGRLKAIAQGLGVVAI